jgi:DNA-directed RNA polymerase subunit M/transcription elongation factor TFIIS
MRCQDCNGMLKATQGQDYTLYACLRCEAKYIWAKLSVNDEAYYKAVAAIRQSQSCQGD